MYGLKKNVTAKAALAVAAVMMFAAASAVGQSVDPCSKTSKLSGGTTFTSNTNGNASLSGSSYGYEMWTNGGNNNKLIWYGANQGGGAAFRAEWNNPNDFLGRIGYYWGNGGKYTQYKNMYCDFNFTRSGRSTAGDYSYIGIYGWTKSPLVEYYIVEDWYGNRYQSDETPITTSTTSGSEVGKFTVDGSEYKIVKNTRNNEPSIEGNTTFTQYFSIRQKQRKCGSISITEHFKQWEKLGLNMGNMYEVKFLVEAGGGTGWFEATYLTFSQEEQPRNGSTPPPAKTYTLTVSASPANGGTVTQSPTGTSFTADTKVTLTATANSGYKFEGWSGDTTGTKSPITVTMNANKNITAKFAVVTGIATDRSVTKPILRAAPTSSGVKVTVRSQESGAATLRLYNLKGDILSTANLQTVSGNIYTHTLSPIAGKLPGGLYMVSLQRNGGAAERMAVLVK
jgi:endo-1,4-beta-xylanase